MSDSTSDTLLNSAVAADASAMMRDAPSDLRELLYSYRVYGRFIADGWIDVRDSAAQLCRKLFVCILAIDALPSVAWLVYMAAAGGGSVAVVPRSPFLTQPFGQTPALLIIFCFIAASVFNLSAFIYVSSLARSSAAATASSAGAPGTFSVPLHVFGALLMWQLAIACAHGWAIGFDVGTDVMCVRVAGLVAAAALGRSRRLGIVLLAAAILLFANLGVVGNGAGRATILRRLWPFANAHALLLLLLYALLVRDVFLVQRWPAVAVADQTAVLERAVRDLVAASAAMAEVGAGPGSSRARSEAAMTELLQGMQRSGKDFYALVERLSDPHLACALLVLRNQLVEAAVLNRSSAIATAALANERFASSSERGSDLLDSGAVADGQQKGQHQSHASAAAARLQRSASDAAGGSGDSPAPPARLQRRRSSAMLRSDSGTGGPVERGGSFNNSGGGVAGARTRTACLLVLHSANARRAVAEAAEMEELLAQIAAQNGGFLHQGSTTLRAIVSWNAVAEQQYMFENHVSNAVLALRHRCRNFFYGVALTGPATAPCPRTMSILSDNWPEARLHGELLKQAEAHGTILIDFATAVASFDFQLDLVDIYSRDVGASILGAPLETLRAARRLTPLFSVVREARGDTNEKAVDAARFAVQGKWAELNGLLQDLVDAIESGEHQQQQQRGSNNVLDADDIVVRALDELVQVNLVVPPQVVADVPVVEETDT